MDEALCSILCNDEQYWDHGWFHVKFKKDGTGEVCTSRADEARLRHWRVIADKSADSEQLLFIGDIGVYLFCVNFKWRCLPRSGGLLDEKKAYLEETPQTENPSPRRTWRKQPQVLGKLELEITLEKSLPTSFKDSANTGTFAAFNLERLSDAACRPKIFSVTFQKGNFVSEDIVGVDSNNIYYGFRHELRMSFDRSLVPPIEELNNPRNHGVFEHDYWWKIKDYVTRPLPEAASNRPAMNDSGPFWMYEKWVASFVKALRGDWISHAAGG